MIVVLITLYMYRNTQPWIHTIKTCSTALKRGGRRVGGRGIGREGGREGGRERGREGGRELGREGAREGGRKIRG